MFLVFASMATAQSEYGIQVRTGIGDVVAAPYTRVAVQIARSDTRPFVGRIVVEISENGGFGGRRGGRGPQESQGEVSISQDVTLEEGATTRIVTLDVPISGRISMVVRLERQVTGDYYETVAEQEDAPPVVGDDRNLVGFVTDARLEAAQQYLFFQAVEIPVAELPDSWKPLAGFAAIVLNDDRISRTQSMALVDYVTAGGTLIISPSSAGSFNPETPAGSLLRIPSTTGTRTDVLKDYSDLLTGALIASGFNNSMPGGGMPPEGGEIAPDGTEIAQPVLPSELVQPDVESPLVIWPESGRAKPVPDTGGLVSIARVGAGNIVLLHTDISSAPFATTDGIPTTAAVKLLNLAMKPVEERRSKTPLRLLVDKDVRDVIDIAGHRIPGRDVLLIVLLLYIAIAGVGMFVVARRIRKPELYPATLLLAAIVSVALVFGIGEVYKRSGDRVKAVRILVSDETTDRNALFTLGCAYAVDGESYSFVNSRKTVMLPALLDPRAISPQGMPGDPHNYTTNFTTGESTTKVTELDRWQNVFFVEREPANVENFAVDVSAMEGGIYKVENLTEHELRACVLLVGGAPVAGGTSCKWHYVSKIGAKGGPDAGVTFSDSTILPDDVDSLAAQVADDTDDLELGTLGAMFSINPEDRMAMALSLGGIESRLIGAGLLPGEGEFLLVAVLPADALSGNSLGAQGVEEDDVGQVNLWMVRGGVEGR